MSSSVHFNHNINAILHIIKLWNFKLAVPDGRIIIQPLFFPPSGFFLWRSQVGIQCRCTQWRGDGGVPLQEGEQCFQDLEQVNENEKKLSDKNWPVILCFICVWRRWFSIQNSQLVYQKKLKVQFFTEITVNHISGLFLANTAAL